MNDILTVLLKELKTKKNKDLYILYFLKTKWRELSGPYVAAHSQLKKIENKTVFVGVSNSVLANELLMNKRTLLEKLNAAIPVNEKDKKITKLEEIRIYNAKIDNNHHLTATEQDNNDTITILNLDTAEKEQVANLTQQIQDPPLQQKMRKIITKDKRYKKTIAHYEHNFCQVCGVPLADGQSYCAGCYEQKQAALRVKLAKIIRNAPWISYEKCLNYLKCDIMVFNDVKGKMTNWAVSEACKEQATDNEKLFAVMLEKGLEPSNIYADNVNKIIGIYKRKMKRN